MGAYSPREFKALSFHDATPRFADGTDTPRAYLGRCLEAVAAREPGGQLLDRARLVARGLEGRLEVEGGHDGI